MRLPTSERAEAAARWAFALAVVTNLVAVVYIAIHQHAEDVRVERINREEIRALHPAERDLLPQILRALAICNRHPQCAAALARARHRRPSAAARRSPPTPAAPPIVSAPLPPRAPLAAPRGSSGSRGEAGEPPTGSPPPPRAPPPARSNPPPASPPPSSPPPPPPRQPPIPLPAPVGRALCSFVPRVCH